MEYKTKERKYIWAVSVSNYKSDHIETTYFDNEEAANEFYDFINEDSNFATIKKIEVFSKFEV